MLENVKFSDFVDMPYNIQRFLQAMQIKFVLMKKILFSFFTLKT